MSVDVKIGDDILYGASVVRLESATTPGTYEEFTLGGGGYPESVIADETVTLVDSPAYITLDPGANVQTFFVWKVKVNDIELEYTPEMSAHVKEVDGITYAVFSEGDKAGLFVGVLGGGIAAGDYTVNIVSPPTMDITENGPVDVSDVAAAFVDVQPVFDTREVTVELDSNSASSRIYIQYYYVTPYGGGNAIMAKLITIDRGSSQTLAVYEAPTGDSARLVVFVTGGTAAMTSISGSNINVTFSADKSMALVGLRDDNDHILVS